MPDTVVFEYREQFAMEGNADNDAVNALLSGVDPFVDGYFLAMSVERKAAPMSPVLGGMNVALAYDEKIDHTRIAIVLKFEFPAEAAKCAQSVTEDLNNAISAFMATRFAGAQRKP